MPCKREIRNKGDLMEKEIVYVKQKFQYSKIITTFILLIITITWAVGLYKYWNEVDLFNYLLDYTREMALGALPYFCLAMTDRVQYAMQYWAEIKNK